MKSRFGNILELATHLIIHHWILTLTTESALVVEPHMKWALGSHELNSTSWYASALRCTSQRKQLLNIWIYMF